MYFWMAILSIIAGFVMAFGIGANDVANSFGSSVASKALSLAQAIIVASIFEFLGSILLGQSVTGTIRSGILHSSYYESAPELLMFGMLNSLIIASVWLLTATAFEFPVSTTHTIVAAIIGFSIAVEGFDSINWQAAGQIFICWFAAPTLAGAIAFCFFYAVKNFVFVEGASREQTFNRALIAYPLVIFVGVTINIAFITLRAQGKVTEKKKIEDYGVRVAFPASIIGGAVSALLTVVVLIPYLKRKVHREHAEHEEEVRRLEAEEKSAMKEDTTGNERQDSDQEDDHDSFEDEEVYTQKNIFIRVWDFFADNTFRQDLETQAFNTSQRAKEIWENMENHDPLTERLFSYLQVFTACLTSFAHGSNDVANAIAPLAAVLEIYQTGQVPSKSSVPKWLLAMGGAAIGIGFTLFGYKTLRALGYKLTCITPSRGFCIELATALSVSIASYASIPVSTTQCLVGATVGAGVASGGLRNVQWLFLLRTVLGWAGFFVVCCICSCGVFAYCTFSPSVVQVVN